MTSSGSLSLVLEAIASGHSELCGRALDELYSSVTLKPKFEMSPLVGNIFEDYFKKIQDYLLGAVKSIPGRITGRIKDKVDKLDKKLNEKNKKHSSLASSLHVCGKAAHFIQLYFLLWVALEMLTAENYVCQ